MVYPGLGFETLILVTLEKKERYGLEIAHEITRLMSPGAHEMGISVGSLYITLRRMSKKGFIKGRPEDPAGRAWHIGARRHFYTITPSGLRILTDIRTLLKGKPVFPQRRKSHRNSS